MSSMREKRVRRKVVKYERVKGGGVPGWILDLDCGHTTEVTGWGNGSGIAAPRTTVCQQCSAAIRKED